MFEFIGMLVVLWVGFVLVRAVYRACSTVSSQDHGVEAKRIAVFELGVPHEYFLFQVQFYMDEVKAAAMGLKDCGGGYSKCSWPRLMAVSIYMNFHMDCLRINQSGSNWDLSLGKLGINPEIIDKEVSRDAREVVFNATRAVSAPAGSVGLDEFVQMEKRRVRLEERIERRSQELAWEKESERDYSDLLKKYSNMRREN